MSQAERADARAHDADPYEKLKRADRATRGARLLAIASVVVLSACGSGGGSKSSTPAEIPWTQGVFAASSTFEARCAAPRSGIDPFTGRRFPDMAGSTLAESNWLRSWTNELYLWYREVPDIDPHTVADPLSYFDLLKTSATTQPSGAPKDKFHFTFVTSDWEAFSQSGTSAGYGIGWTLVSAVPPREVRVAYVQPGSVAANAGVPRGAEVLTIDGVDMVNGANVDALNAGLFPAGSGEQHTFTLRNFGSANASPPLTLTSNTTPSQPVFNVQAIQTGATRVGYMLFNDHIATAESALVDAIVALQGVDDLVIDIRYNGGGFLDIASELAFMVAGSTNTTGKTFEKTVFNDKYPVNDPFTGQPIQPVPFWSTAQGFTITAGTPLPTLNLSRVFVLTTADTCSASESIINSLRGAGVQVFQFGSTTCGKPYGFFPQDNCGTTYFSIQFKGVNQANFGDYTDGFSPANTVSLPGVSVPGCSVADDFGHALGDPLEDQLAAALAYRAAPGTCPAPTGTAATVAKIQSMRTASKGLAIASPQTFRNNRILRR